MEGGQDRPMLERISRRFRVKGSGAVGSPVPRQTFLGVLSLRGGSTSASAPDRPPEPLLRGAPRRGTGRLVRR
jgi:hypothetical protein